MNLREIVLDILLELSRGGEYSNILISAVLDKYDYLDGREKAFIKRVSEGCIERRIQIDYVLDQFSKTPVRKMKPLIRELLRMSTYQLLFMEHIPDAAVCNEAVKLAKKRKFQALQGYVNGVLRNIARGREKISYPDRVTSYREYLSVQYSMPLWLVEHFADCYGEDFCEKILQAYLERKSVGVRIRENLPQGEQERLIAAWEQAGICVRRHPYLSYAVELEGIEGIRRMEGYEEGLFAVQDVSSMLVVETAGIRLGDTVVDVCAAPGGKALHAADKLAGTGQVIAFDVTDHKTARIMENQTRLGIQNVSVKVQDARIQEPSLLEKADVLLVDVPCSGLGVIGRKQDIKYRVTPESLQEINRLQREIVANVVKYVKPGGIMMYSTCTMNPSENEEMAAWICEDLGMEKVNIAPFLPESLWQDARENALQLLPGVHETDGFFMAKFRKR